MSDTTHAYRARAHAGIRTAAHVLAGIFIATIGGPWVLHGQDQSSSTAYQLSVLTKQFNALQQKVAALEQQGSRVKAPFEVVDAASKSILKVEQGPDGPMVTVGAGRPGKIVMGLGASGAAFVAVNRADGTEGVSVGQLSGQPMGVRVMDRAGQKPVATLSADPRGNGFFNVGDPDTGGVSIGTGATSGTGYFLLRRANGKDAVGIGDRPNEPTGMVVYDASGTKSTAAIGTDSSGSGTITVADSTARPILRVAEKATTHDARVSIGAPEGRYALTVAGSSGSPLAAVGEARNGGGTVNVSDKAGQTRAVMNGLAGEIHVIDGGGKSRATMVTDNGQGAFSIRNASGVTVLRIGEGNAGGLIQIANSGGNAMVEAGVLGTGAGLVRAFPLGSPGAGLVGMPGTFIMGRLAQGK